MVDMQDVHQGGFGLSNYHLSPCKLILIVCMNEGITWWSVRSDLRLTEETDSSEPLWFSVTELVSLNYFFILKVFTQSDYLRQQDMFHKNKQLIPAGPTRLEDQSPHPVSVFQERSFTGVTGGVYLVCLFEQFI